MDKDLLQQLADKISKGVASDEEIARYNHWYNAVEELAGPQVGEGSDDMRLRETKLFNRIESEINKVEKSSVRHLFIKVAAAAACLVLLSSAVYLLYKRSYEPSLPTNTMVKNAAYPLIKPGGNKAVLTLSNGEKIILNEVDDKQQLANEQGINIKKMADGQLVYEITATAFSNKDKSPSTSISYHTIETPVGGQYQVILPDGSKVWLNAASSIKYPIDFFGGGRMVELRGEAYFEVAGSQKAAKHPFIVNTPYQRVAVLGTHFNVNAYEEEGTVKTTLLEGAVKVRTAVGELLLKPGQQAVLQLSNRAFYVQPTDLEKAVAWKNGYFIFNKENIRSVMRQVARWYDVDVAFKGAIQEEDQFVGRLPRNVDISEILKILKLSKVKYQVDGRKITIEN